MANKLGLSCAKLRANFFCFGRFRLVRLVQFGSFGLADLILYFWYERLSLAGLAC